MPAFQTVGPVTAIYPGDEIALVNNAAVDANVTASQQVAIGGSADGNTAPIVVVNSTNQDATGQACLNIAASDPLTAASYKALSGLVVTAGTAMAYNLAPTIIRFTFASAPTSGSLVVQR